MEKKEIREKYIQIRLIVFFNEEILENINVSFKADKLKLVIHIVFKKSQPHRFKIHIYPKN